MSCGTLSQSLVGLNVSMASLPEGFCPTSMQDLANAIAARLIVTPNQATSSFAIGSVPPTSNVGPWLKDCEIWFIFDDATATYVPMRKGGFDSMQYFSANGTFVVPADIFKIKIHAWGAGGGGSAGGAQSGSGGGGGAYGLVIVDVTPGQNIPLIVGTGGGANTDGGNTALLTFTAGGGKGAISSTVAGLGGVATGFAVNIAGGPGMGNVTAGLTNSDGSGGDAGGWGGSGGEQTIGATDAGRSGIAPGGGGAGGAQAANTTAGSGAVGGILIEF